MEVFDQPFVPMQLNRKLWFIDSSFQYKQPRLNLKQYILVGTIKVNITIIYQRIVLVIGEAQARKSKRPCLCNVQRNQLHFCQQVLHAMKRWPCRQHYLHYCSSWQWHAKEKEVYSSPPNIQWCYCSPIPTINGMENANSQKLSIPDIQLQQHFKSYVLNAECIYTVHLIITKPYDK